MKSRDEALGNMVVVGMTIRERVIPKLWLSGDIERSEHSLLKENHLLYSSRVSKATFCEAIREYSKDGITPTPVVAGRDKLSCALIGLRTQEVNTWWRICGCSVN